MRQKSFWVETDPEGEPTEVLATDSTADGDTMFDIQFYGTAADLVALGAAVARRMSPDLSARAFAQWCRRGKIEEIEE